MRNPKEIDRRAFVAGALGSTAGIFLSACDRLPLIGQDPELKVEPGWKRFASPNYPYEINCPADWLTTTGFAEGFIKADVFNGPRVREGQIQLFVYPEKIEPHVTYDIYLQQVLDQKQIAGRRWSKEEYDLTIKNLNRLLKISVR